LEENQGMYIRGLELGNSFLYMKSEAQATKKKLIIWTLAKYTLVFQRRLSKKGTTYRMEENISTSSLRLGPSI